MMYVYIHVLKLVYLVGQVVPADQCLPSLHFSLEVHLDHLVLASHPNHPSLVAPKKCVCLVG